MSNDLNKIEYANIIADRAKLKNNLIPRFILECLCIHRSASLEQITTFVDASIGGATEWRASKADELFVGDQVKSLVHSSTIERNIQFINEKLATIDNTNIEKEVLLAKIHKITVDIHGELIYRYVLVHNWVEVK